MVNNKRIISQNADKKINGPIIYWMSRDQRVEDNWALLYAQELSIQHKTPLVVIFCLRKKFSYATERIVNFMIEGLKEVEKKLLQYSIPFVFLTGEPPYEIEKFVKVINAGAIVSDFSPLKYRRRWNEELSKKINIPFFEVDSHNIVPVWEASSKLEFAAYTIRPKIESKLYEFLEEYPSVKKQFYSLNLPNNEWVEIISSLQIDGSIKKVSWIKSGSKEAHKTLDEFIKIKIENYDRDRNDPNKDGQSNLSAYLHFGQISSQRIVLEIKRRVKESYTKAFFEELIVRKELSDNFCFYNENYDSPKGYPEWSKKTLSEHRGDKREYIYTNEDFEGAKTHDPLWNAAQKQLLSEGKMHGYMRMYWAKKILEWSRDVNDAHATALFLNDKYSFDGRDPNGYTGIAWSIGGVHDRAWFEREVFGSIRYMNFNGAKRKFDVGAYINKYT